MIFIAKFIFILVACSAIIPLQSETYTFISKLGAGSNGEVHLAKDKDQKLFAIKRMQAKEELLKSGHPANYVNAIYAHDSLCLNSLWEFQKSVRLNHPNIMKIYDCFCAIDSSGFNRTFLVMDYIEGKTLDETLPGSMSREQALKNAYQFLDALKSALTPITQESTQLDHLLNPICASQDPGPLASKLCDKTAPIYPLIHRDIHSANVMIDENQELKLIDLDSFGELFPKDEKFEEMNQNYFENLFPTLKEILACGEFNKQELEIYSKAMDEVLQKFQDYLQQPLSLESLNFYIAVFEDLQILFL